MSCFSCFGSADEPDPRPAVKQKPVHQVEKQQQPLPKQAAAPRQTGPPQKQTGPPQKQAGPQLQNSEQLAALTGNSAPQSKPSFDPFKQQADAQADRFGRTGAPAPSTPPKVARLSPQNNGGTPAYMAIPPLGQPLNGKAKTPTKGRPIPERRPLTDSFASQLPPLEDGRLQSSPPSFKGFLTENKKSSPSVLNTGDIWKPKLSGSQNKLTPPGAQGSGGLDSRRGSDADSRSNFTPTEPAQRSYDFEANGIERPLAKDNQGLSKFMTDPRAKVDPTSISPTSNLPIAEELTTPAMSAAEPSRLATRPVVSRGSSLNSDSSPREGEARGGLRRTVSGNPAEQGLAGGELYEFVSQLGVGSTGITRLMRDKRTRELVAAKWVPHTAGEMLSVQVEREILNHRRLLHNNVVRFREVFATDDHLVIVTDYATAGSLCTHIEAEGAIPEKAAKDFFRQLADGITYCHRLGIVHRNLRLEKLLLDGQPAFPILKISGFAYSKAPALDSAPKSIVGGGPTYMAPEMLLATREGASYDGRALDVWSAGVCLYTMLTGNLPFKDPNEPGILSRKLMQRIVNCIFEFPGHLNLSEECRDLITKILVPDPKKRIDSYSLSSHPWLAGTSLRKTPSIAISKQSESDISSVMERARRRKEARMAVQRANARSNGAFNEDLLDE